MFLIADCIGGEVRLVSGPSSSEGRVEVCFEGVWGTVTGTGFGLQEAVVVCKQLGFFQYCML